MRREIEEVEIEIEIEIGIEIEIVDLRLANSALSDAIRHHIRLARVMRRLRIPLRRRQLRARLRIPEARDPLCAPYI